MKARQLLIALLMPLLIGGCSSGKKTDERQQAVVHERQLVLPEIPVMVRSDAERRLYLLDHYWDSVDFTEPGIERDTLFITRSLIDYLGLSKGVDQDRRRPAAQHLIGQVERNPEALSLLMSSLSALLYDPSSARYDETLYLPFVEAAIGSDSITAAERDRLVFAREQIRKNYPGTAATDFSYKDVEGRSHHLGGLYDTVPILIFFFRPDCSGCDVLAQQMRHSAVLDRALEERQIRILALATAGTVEEWEEKRSHFDPRWLQGRNVRDFEGIELYDFRAMPTFYLLSGEGIVLIKDQPFPVVEQYLSQGESDSI
ncbi:DUF5106 domain-containing protein [Porphyromonas bennonis]|uniref:DUF5106 domain-containing protein n=1 Tax=Porphyromonas bennonis TaxID=501496 RepID=UPI0009DABCD8|nr:DUF5106 domain-containing protein [Porphyromonas bennonis]